MRKLTILLLIILSSCSSDLDIMQDYPNKPIVYAAINPYDSVYTVRVQKTFKIYHKEDFGTLNADSLHYNDVEVSLSGISKNEITWTVSFKETIGSRESGFFPENDFKYFVYHGKLPINLSAISDYHGGFPDIDSLQLSVKIHDLNIITQATVPIMTPGVINPKPRITYIRLYHEYPTQFAMVVGSPAECAPGTEGCFQQIEFCIHYKDHYSDSVETRKLSWVSNEGWNEGSYKLNAARLFGKMVNLFPSDESILARTLDSIDVSIVRPNRVFSNYWEVREYWDNIDRPPYSNFDNSYGMFFTYQVGVKTGYSLDNRVMDSLCNGYYYKKMKFRPW